MGERVLANRARYDAMARSYAAAVRFARFGFERFYREVASELLPCPGGAILDVGCGLGTLVPHLRQKVAPGGRIVGVDVSDAMIEHARALARREGWTDVELNRADVRDFAPTLAFDAVVFCLSLTTMPDPEERLARALAWLRPRGQLVVLDSFPEPQRRFARWIIEHKARLVGAEPSDRPLRLLERRLEGVRVRRFHAGVYMLVSGRKPAEALHQSGDRP